LYKGSADHLKAFCWRQTSACGQMNLMFKFMAGFLS